MYEWKVQLREHTGFRKRPKRRFSTESYYLKERFWLSQYLEEWKEVGQIYCSGRLSFMALTVP